MEYNLRTRKVTKYAEDERLTLRGQRKRTRKQKSEKLYELEVVERDRVHHRVKVHYVGYNSDNDEWRDEKDIKIIYPVQGIVRCNVIATLPDKFEKLSKIVIHDPKFYTR